MDGKKKTGNSLEYDRAWEERLESSLNLLAFFSPFRLSLFPLTFHIF